jgi:hypothetical protein
MGVKSEKELFKRREAAWWGLVLIYYFAYNF